MSAGTGTPGTSPPTGWERTFAVNHLAPFLLTNLLLDRMRQAGPARVVTVSSHAHARGRIDFDDLQGERSYSGARAYNQSKLANLLFTYALARRLQKTRSPPTRCIPAWYVPPSERTTPSSVRPAIRRESVAVAATAL